MYKRTHIVPRITTEHLDSIKTAAGHLAPLIRLTTVESENRAASVAAEALTVLLRVESQTETLDSLHSVTLDEKGENYAVVFNIIGD